MIGPCPAAARTYIARKEKPLALTLWTWVRQRKKSAVVRFTAKFFKPGNVLLALLWVAWLALVVYVQSHAQESELFDPYELLQARCLPHWL